MAAVPVKEMGTLRCLECGRVYTDVPFLPPPSGLCTCPGTEEYDPKNRYRKVKWEWTDGKRVTVQEGEPDTDMERVASGHPVQIWKYDAEHHRFQATPDALKVLSKFKAPIHSTAIFGDIRQGKSLLLNQLIGLLREKNSPRFHVDPNSDSFTQGIWMWSEPMVYDGKTFAFFDFQGKEGEAGFDTEMLSLLMSMTSLCLVQQITTIHDPFISLEPIVSLIDMLQQRSDALIDPRIRAAAAKEADQQEGSAEVTIPRALDKRSFLPPTLMFLVRDCSARIREQLPEKLERIMASDPTEKVSTRYTGRNVTRQQIKDNVNDVTVFGVCRSADDDTLSSDDFQQVTESELHPKFVSQVGELLDFIRTKSKPKEIAGKPADGASLLSQMHMIADLINDGFTSVSVPALRNNITDTLTKAISVGVAKYQELAEQLVSSDDDWHKKSSLEGMKAFDEICNEKELSAFSMNLGQTQLEATFDNMGQQIILTAMQMSGGE
eukprot:TRINITY_DN6587_c5_g1_i1.p1 TRINITY_DN6587_c5_g1~~TRINITY_DN6587_c5_g1_i1.p1  ORF type:complete len:512 (+),score=130.14 TRINITY_DN6587_c5_g1_i1:59-1537(+)